MFSILEIARAQSTNGKPESAYLDINSDKPIRLTSKIMVPAKEFPRVIIHICIINVLIDQSYSNLLLIINVIYIFSSILLVNYWDLKEIR